MRYKQKTNNVRKKKQIFDTYLLHLNYKMYGGISLYIRESKIQEY